MAAGVLLSSYSDVDGRQLENVEAEWIGVVLESAGLLFTAGLLVGVLQSADVEMVGTALPFSFFIPLSSGRK